MENKSCLAEEVYFWDRDIFGDEKEHYYNVECFDGHAVATKSEAYDDDKAPAKLRVTYPKREEVIKNKEMTEEVLDYRGLDGLTADDITYSDIMIYYGKLEIMN